MKIEVKGNSGCQIDVVSENGGLYVYKSTADPKYLNRLVLQADKQQAAEKVQHQHIRVPKIYELEQNAHSTVIKMQYVYSKNFIEFFEQAGFEQVEYLIDALEQFIEYEIAQSPLQQVPVKIFQDKFDSIRKTCEFNPLYEGDTTIQNILNRSEQVFAKLGKEGEESREGREGEESKGSFSLRSSGKAGAEGPTSGIGRLLSLQGEVGEEASHTLQGEVGEEAFLTLPVGLCHGDLTFSNILFNGNNYYLIDFLDSFVETPLQDIVKIRQDTQFRWSQLMYTKRYDAVRLHIVMDKIDREIDTYFAAKYPWYRDSYQMMQLMNILRILPYAKEQKVVEYLKNTLCDILDGLESEEGKEGREGKESKEGKEGKEGKECFSLRSGGRAGAESSERSESSESLSLRSSGEAGTEGPTSGTGRLLSLQGEAGEEAFHTLQGGAGEEASLLVPVAADKPEYANDLPYVFGLDKDGVILCLKSIMGLELDKFDHIYFTVLKKHDDQFFISDLLNLQFKRLGIKNAKVVVLDEPTRDQAETIYQTIQAENIKGRIFIKDADSYFQAEITDTDGVAICPIESLDILTPKDKSYVAVDDMYYITNIIEKSVVGHYISAGGYLLDVAEFCHYYHQMRGFGRLYLSHIIYAMLLDKRTFRPMMVEEYKDWGTKGDWNRSGEG